MSVTEEAMEVVCVAAAAEVSVAVESAAAAPATAVKPCRMQHRVTVRAPEAARSKNRPGFSRSGATMSTPNATPADKDYLNMLPGSEDGRHLGSSTSSPRS